MSELRAGKVPWETSLDLSVKYAINKLLKCRRAGGRSKNLGVHGVFNDFEGTDLWVPLHTLQPQFRRL